MKKAFISICCAVALTGCCSQGASSDAAPTCAANKASMEKILNFENKILPEHVSAYKTAFLKCQEATLKEEGCIHYSLYQSLTDSTMFYIAEVWENEAALAKHSDSEHLATLRAETKGMRDSSFKGLSRNVYICPDANQ